MFTDQCRGYGVQEYDSTFPSDQLKFSISSTCISTLDTYLVSAVEHCWFLFRRSFPWLVNLNFCSACAVTVIIFRHLNRSFYLLTATGLFLRTPSWATGVHKVALISSFEFSASQQLALTWNCILLVVPLQQGPRNLYGWDGKFHFPCHFWWPDWLMSSNWSPRMHIKHLSCTFSVALVQSIV